MLCVYIISIKRTCGVAVRVLREKITTASNEMKYEEKKNTCLRLSAWQNQFKFTL